MDQSFFHEVKIALNELLKLDTMLTINLNLTENLVFKHKASSKIKHMARIGKNNLKNASEKILDLFVMPMFGCK